MIQITLTFPTVAAARQAMLELPENLLGITAFEVPAAEVKKEAAKKEATAKPAPVSTPPTAEPAAAPEPKAEPSAPAAVEYPVLQKAVFALAAKDRDTAMAVVSSFGVKTFKELDQSKWADALAAVHAKLNELGAQ